MVRGVALMGPDHRFIVLSVVPSATPGAGVSPMDIHPTLVDPALEAALEHDEVQGSTAELGRMVRLLGLPDDAQVEIKVEVGESGMTICDVAEEVGADVVVLGSHGHGWLERVLLGSVSKHVLHHAPSAVLVMRPAQSARGPAEPGTGSNRGSSGTATSSGSGPSSSGSSSPRASSRARRRRMSG